MDGAMSLKRGERLLRACIGYETSLKLRDAGMLPMKRKRPERRKGGLLNLCCSS